MELCQVLKNRGFKLDEGGRMSSVAKKAGLLSTISSGISNYSSKARRFGILASHSVSLNALS